MTDSVQHLLASFDRLGRDEQDDAATEILRRTATRELPRLSDAALTEGVGQLFAELDQDEALSHDEQWRLLNRGGRRAGWDDPEMDVYNDQVK